MVAVTLPSSSGSSGKGNATARIRGVHVLQADNSGTADSGSDDESDSDPDEEIGQEFMNSLLERARRNAALKKRAHEDGKCNLRTGDHEEEEILRLDSSELDQQYVRRCNLFSQYS